MKNWHRICYVGGYEISKHVSATGAATLTRCRVDADFRAVPRRLGRRRQDRTRTEEPFWKTGILAFQEVGGCRFDADAGSDV